MAVSGESGFLDTRNNKQGVSLWNSTKLGKPCCAKGADISFWQEFYVKFYQAFIEGGRWQQYLRGVGTTLLATAMALAIGIAPGCRHRHDPHRP